MARIKKHLPILLLCFTVGLPALAVNSNPSLEYIDYHFENGSPLFWDVREDGSIVVSLLYDHERNSPNRAAIHWHFRIYAKKDADLKIVLQNFDNIWNGVAGSPINDKTSCYISVDGRKWTNIICHKTPENRLEFNITMPADSVYVARLEPYRLSDLEKLKSEIRDHPLVKITQIGETVEGRPLEIIRVGYVTAPHRVFIRARAHAWEPGGNWVVQGLIKNLLRNDPKIKAYLERYCIYILPMANKDRVAHGGTRFNLRGKDLNRNWDKPADPYLAPENAALENWLRRQTDLGFKPDLAIDFHNDSGGKIHIARPEVNLDAYLVNMEKFEALLRKHTWFTEGSTGSNFRNPGSIGEGFLERFGVDSFVYELNANWIEGLKKVPFGRDWELLGKQLCQVFYDYFGDSN